MHNLPKKIKKLFADRGMGGSYGFKPLHVIQYLSQYRARCPAA